jgi:hypothetical protein
MQLEQYYTLALYHLDCFFKEPTVNTPGSLQHDWALIHGLVYHQHNIVMLAEAKRAEAEAALINAQAKLTAELNAHDHSVAQFNRLAQINTDRGEIIESDALKRQQAVEKLSSLISNDGGSLDEDLKEVIAILQGTAVSA